MSYVTTHCIIFCCVRSRNKLPRRIRDSLATWNKGGWTTDMEQTLLKLAAEYNHDFDLVASTLANEHNSKRIIFDSDSCFRRWSFLDLTSVGNVSISAGDNCPQEDIVIPSTEKTLS